MNWFTLRIRFALAIVVVLIIAIVVASVFDRRAQQLREDDSDTSAFFAEPAGTMSRFFAPPEYESEDSRGRGSIMPLAYEFMSSNEETTFTPNFFSTQDSPRGREAGTQADTQTDAVNFSSLWNAYSFTTRGWITTASSKKERTPLEQRLFDYGNSAGAIISSLDSEHESMLATLKNFFDNRANTERATAVTALANKYRELGEKMERMANIPVEVEDAHETLATTYREIANGLEHLTRAKSDEELLAAVNSYNASADEFTKSFVALATLFSAYGVTFSATDSGRIFVFAQ